MIRGFAPSPGYGLPSAPAPAQVPAFAPPVGPRPGKTSPGRTSPGQSVRGLVGETAR